MTDNIEYFPWVDKGKNIDPDDVLDSALGKLTEVIVIGYDKQGDFHIAASGFNCPDILWMIEKAKNTLLHTERKVLEDDDDYER